MDRHLQRWGLGRCIRGAGKIVQELGQLLPKTQKLGAQGNLALRAGLGWAAALMTPQITDAFAGAGNRVAIVVEKLANEHRELDIATAVLPMCAAGFLRAERRELGFPVAERVRLDAHDVRDLANLEEQLVRQLSAPCHS